MRLVPVIRVFGYGSLLNKKTVEERMPKAQILGPAHLGGYQRTFRKLSRPAGPGHVYLTLQPHHDLWVRGVLIEMKPTEFVALTRSEPGYNLVEISDGLEGYPKYAPPVYCFIAKPSEQIPADMRSIRRSYLRRCLEGVPEDEQKQWLESTEIPEGVIINENE